MDKNTTPSEELQELPKYSFELIKCVLDVKKVQALMEITLTYPQIKKVHKAYQLFFQFNPEPWNERIRVLQDKITRIYAQPSLLPETQERQEEEINEQIRKEVSERDKFAIECHDIMFVAYTQKVEYGDRTKIVFQIPRDKLNIINDQLANITLYKLQLEIL